MVVTATVVGAAAVVVVVVVDAGGAVIVGGVGLEDRAGAADVGDVPDGAGSPVAVTWGMAGPRV